MADSGYGYVPLEMQEEQELAPPFGIQETPEPEPARAPEPRRPSAQPRIFSRAQQAMREITGTANIRAETADDEEPTFSPEAQMNTQKSFSAGALALAGGVAAGVTIIGGFIGLAKALYNFHVPLAAERRGGMLFGKPYAPYTAKQRLLVYLGDALIAVMLAGICFLLLALVVIISTLAACSSDVSCSANLFFSSLGF